MKISFQFIAPPLRRSLSLVVLFLFHVSCHLYAQDPTTPAPDAPEAQIEEEQAVAAPTFSLIP